MATKLSDLSELSFTSKAEVSCDYSIIRESEKEPSPPDQDTSYVVIKTKPQEKCSEMSFEYMPKNQEKIPKDTIEDLSFKEDEKHEKASNSAEHDSSKQIQQESIAKVQVDDPSVSLILAPGENPSLEINMPKNQPEDDGRREKLIASEGPDELKINWLELGSQFFKQGDFEKAAYNFEKVVAQQADHISGIDMNTVFKKLATAYSKQMKFDKSLTVIQQSWIPFLEKSRQALPYDLFMAKGKALRKLSKPQAALKEFQQAYEKKSKECGSTHPEVGLVLLEIAKTQRDLGEFTQAQNRLLTALSIFKRCPRMPQAILTAVYQEHSTILVELGEYGKARQVLYDCVRSMKNNGDNSMEGAICYCSLGAVSFRIGDYSLAYQQYKKAKIILTSLGKGDDCLMAKVEKGIGDVFNSRNERLKAASQYSLALSIQRKFSQKDSPEIASLLCTLADIKCKLQQFQECRLCLEKAYSIYNNYDDHQSLANVYHLYGNLFAEQDQNNEAFSSYQNALTLSLKSHSANYPELAPLYKRLGKVCAILGLISLAVEYYGKFLTIKDKELQSSNSEAIEVQSIYKALKQGLY